jgi:hypothetical protein
MWALQLIVCKTLHCTGTALNDTFHIHGSAAELPVINQTLK